MPQRLDGVEAGGAVGRVKAEDDADQSGDAEGEDQRGERDDGLFRFGCVLNQNGVPYEMGKLFLLEAGARATPPFSEYEIEEKLRSAYSYEKKNIKANFSTRIQQLQSKVRSNGNG